MRKGSRGAAGMMPSLWVTGKHPVEELLGSKTQRARKVLLSDAVPAETRNAWNGGRGSSPAVPDLLPEEWERRTGSGKGRDRGGGRGVPLRGAGGLDPRPAGNGAGVPPGRRHRPAQPRGHPPERLRLRLRRGDPSADRSCPVTGRCSGPRRGGGAPSGRPGGNLVRAIERLQESGFWLYAAGGRRGGRDIGFPGRATDGGRPGSEEKGVRRLAREKCDGAIRIGMATGAESLNVSVAAGIIAFSLRKA